MNRSKLHRTLSLGAAGIVATSLGIAAQTTGAVDRVREFIAEGKISLDLRPRYEMAETTGADTAHAITLRTRLGYTTREWRGFSGMFELENIASPFPNLYNQSQLNPGGADRAIVTDPTGTEVNQIWLAWQHGPLLVKGGRQRLVFDNGRFIGDYAWRQNMQTLDALLLQYQVSQALTLSYAYVWRANRVFGAEHAQGVYDSNSHLLHATYRDLPGGTLNAYAYLLEFKGNVLGNSCATFGLNYEGARALGRINVAYRAEYALQTNYGNSPLSYSANYFAGEVTAGASWLSGGVGFELQGTDNNFAFRTPLGSLHGFNGWADVFLLTPSQGLRDTYFKVSGRLPWWNIGLVGYHHSFSTDAGTDLGRELDLQATYPISESLSATVKYADFSREATMVQDARKFWVQLELKY